MEILPPLKSLIEPDPRNLAFVVLDRSSPTGTRPPTLADNHLEMEALELPVQVPERVASSFAIARTVWLYGWLYWPFYSLAEHLAFVCIETALRHRAGLQEAAERDEWTPGLKELFALAVDNKWLRDDQYGHIQRLREHQRDLEQTLEQFGWHAPQSAPDQYVRVLAQTAPSMRNRYAHGTGPLVQLKGETRLALQIARDTITQLFGAPDVAGTETPQSIP